MPDEVTEPVEPTAPVEPAEPQPEPDQEPAKPKRKRKSKKAEAPLADKHECPACQVEMVQHGQNWLCKKCGHLCDSTGKECIVTERREDKEILVIDEKTDTLPKTKAECPKCGHNEAYWVIRQTRAADEPETRIYRCTSCSNSWREY